MSVGDTLFVLVMEFVSRKNSGRVIERHKGDADVRMLGCATLLHFTALAQLAGMLAN